MDASYIPRAEIKPDTNKLKTYVDADDVHVLAVDPTIGRTISRAAISAASSGDNTLVAAVAGKKIKVLGMLLVVADDVDVRLESGAGGTALTGVISLAADGNGFVLPVALPGSHWIETAAGALLNLELSGAVQVSGCVVYYVE